MNVIISNKIKIIDPTKKIVDYCKSNLVLDNPEYAKKKRMGVWLGHTPSRIWLYEKIGDEYSLPFGCINDIYALEPDAQYTAKFKPLEAFSYGSTIKLYEYQKQAVETALKSKHGVVVMPCGAGKTQTALEIIARIGGKALWITHTQDLLNQSMDRAKSLFEASSKSYGKITGGKVDIGTGLTFATVQTMAKLNLDEYKDLWDIVVVDECHKAIGSPTKCMQFYRVLSALSVKYKYGVTATPKRADGLESTMFCLLGKIISETPRTAVKATTCPVSVKRVETGYMPDFSVALAGDGTLNYAGLVEDLTTNVDRFHLVLETIENLPVNSPTLVLGNRVKYLEALSREYFGYSQCLSSMGNSKAAKAERKKALKALNDGNIDVLFATYQLAREGLDVPNLRYVVFATPKKDPTTIMQSAGRVARKADGKEKGIVIDFVDNFGLYQGWAKKRQGIYKKLGYDYES